MGEYTPDCKSARIVAEIVDSVVFKAVRDDPNSKYYEFCTFVWCLNCMTESLRGENVCNDFSLEDLEVLARNSIKYGSLIPNFCLVLKL